MSAVLSLGDRVVDLAAGVVTHPRGRVPLAPLEVSLLRYLADRAGEVVSRDDLQVDVWGISRTAQTRSIDVAVSRLRKKLEADPVNPKYLVTLHGSGYRLESVRAAEPAARLPAEVDTFVGRDRELATLREVVARHRVVTVLGPPGVGKTRLALQLARSLPDVSWCPLATARDARDVAPLLARALAVPLRPDEPRGQLARALASRGPGWVWFDDAEGVHDALADLIAELREAAPERCFLTTSRTALQLPGEAVVPLEPLAPDDGADLFLVRAQARGAAAELDRDAVVQLVRELDGLPLAIELAAARLPTLTLGELSERLDDRFTLLAGGSSPRHATLKAALGSTWSALAPPLRAAVCALSALEGSFDTSAAEAVLGPEVDGLARLRELFDRSLLQRDRRAGRWSALSSIRAFAREQAPPGTLDQARARLADHLVARYADAFDRGGPSPEQRAGLAADVGLAVGALEAAVARADGRRAAALLGPTSLALTRAGSLAVAAELAGKVLGMALAPGDRAVPSLVRAHLAVEGAWGEGSPAAHYAAAFEAARDHGAPAMAVRAACGWGRALGRQGDVARGEEVLRGAVAAAGSLDAVTHGTALATLGWHWATDGADPVRARAHLEQALARFAERSAALEAAFAHLGLARVATTARAFAEAASWFERARPALEGDGDALKLVALRYNVANNLLQWRRSAEAVPAAEAAVAAARRTGSARWLASAAGVLATALVEAGRAEEVSRLDLPALAGLGAGPGAGANLWHREGLARLEGGRVAEARQAFAASLSLSPNERYRLQAEVGLAEVEAAEGRVARARERLARLRAATPPADDVDRLLLGAEVKVAAAAGDLAAARAGLARCEAFDEAGGGRLVAPLAALRDRLG